jgi:spore germination protein GerM
MSAGRYGKLVAGLVLIGLLAWAMANVLDRLVGLQPTVDQTAETAAPTAGAPHITATMYYAAADGQTLLPVRREVLLAEGTVQQGREIIAAQLQAAPPPYVSVIPEGITLRAFYVTERGDAFVDFSGDVASKHSGGSSAELLTVYAIVNAITANLPAIRRVQILIEGREADTLVGHVDLRRPLQQDLSLVRQEADSQ